MGGGDAERVILVGAWDGGEARPIIYILCVCMCYSLAVEAVSSSAVGL